MVLGRHYFLVRVLLKQRSCFANRLQRGSIVTGGYYYCYMNYSLENASHLSDLLPLGTTTLEEGQREQCVPKNVEKPDANAAPKRPSRRKNTKTSTFGVSRREGHDAGLFYSRFPPLLQDKTELPSRPALVDKFITGDSRLMSKIADNSVALVVTSPPYYAAKDYELEREKEGIPSSYAEYLEMLHDVFRECWRVLEPGGRIAVNVANLGRRPYRSLSADVIRILQDDIGLLVRGEILWLKAEGASGSCAWGSFQSAANPVLRDLSERVIVASKLRLDRTPAIKVRKEQGLPYENTISKDEFMKLTLDVWKMRPESARKVGHPAPFPVELPRRLIQLFTYKGDLVLDPFMGSGSTAIAAVESGRHFMGYDADPAYVRMAKLRLKGAIPPG